MAGDRAFDDERWPDPDGKADCFLCGKVVDPLDPKRGTYSINPPDIRIPIHVPCVVPYFNGDQLSVKVEILYRKALDDMHDRQRAIMLGR